MINFCMWNIRGLKSRLKKTELSKLIRSFRLSFLVLVETKVEEMNDGIVSSIWPGQNVRWCVNNMDGRAGRILLLWDSSVFLCQRTVCDDRWVWVEGVERSSSCSLRCMGIYAPNVPGERLFLWQRLVDIISNCTLPWVILGDFNETLSPEERSEGSLFDRRGASTLSLLIQQCGLVDLPLLGKCFTWFSSRCASRLDRVLVSPHWIADHHSHRLIAGKQSLSDHIPLFLKAESVSWGFRPFRSWDCHAPYPIPGVNTSATESQEW